MGHLRIDCIFHSLSIKLSLLHLDASYYLEATPNLRISDLTLIWRGGESELNGDKGETWGNARYAGDSHAHLYCITISQPRF